MNPFIANPGRLFAHVRDIAELGADRRSRLILQRDLLRANLGRLHEGWTGVVNRVLSSEPVRVSLRLPHARVPLDFWYRPGTTDLSVLEQVFLDREYDADDGIGPRADQVEYLIDLGSNIGLTALMWAHRFPRARMILVEPDAGNFALLRKNTAALGERARLVQAAVSERDEPVRFYRYRREYGHSLIDREDYRDMLVEAVEVQGITLDSLVAQAGFPRIDLLKVDIEGAEAILLPTIATWSHVPRAMVAELHPPYQFSDFASDCQRVGLTAWPAVPAMTNSPRGRRPLPWATLDPAEISR